MADNVNLKIYLTKSEKTALDKTVEDGIELTGTLRDPSNVVNPSIEIQANVSSIAARNYFIIPEFGRSYFLTEITSTGYGRCIISGHVDVLSTYKDYIRANDAVIGRAENQYNLYLDDNMIKVDAKTKIQIKNKFNGGYFLDNPKICLVVVG